MIALAALVEALVTVAFWAAVMGVPAYVWLRLRKAGASVPDWSRWVTCPTHLDTYPDWDRCRYCPPSHAQQHEGRW